MRKSIGKYPENWSAIATHIKDDAAWQCVRCGHEHDPQNGYCLTVHHLDMNPANCEWWNCPALCQKCHLQIQHKVDMNRYYMFDHSEWFKPYLAGYNAHLLGERTDKEYIMNNLERLIKSRGKNEI